MAWSRSGSIPSVIPIRRESHHLGQSVVFAYDGTAEAVNIIGRIRWFAREI
jgi:hypothetical protein